MGEDNKGKQMVRLHGALAHILSDKKRIEDVNAAFALETKLIKLNRQLETIKDVLTHDGCAQALKMQYANLMTVLNYESTIKGFSEIVRKNYGGDVFRLTKPLEELEENWESVSKLVRHYNKEFHKMDRFNNRRR